MGEARKIVRRTRGQRQGPITRLVSPSDLGQLLKPFVFLDLFEMEKTSFAGIDLHPHSGIVTVSYLFEGTINYEETGGARGVLPAGGLEWFKAAHGAWHGGGPGDTGRARGFQLWIALPPQQELDTPENVYLKPDEVARDGPARVLVGTHGDAASSLQAATPLSYLAVHLQSGEAWRYEPARDHRVAWLALSTGRVRVPDDVTAGELGIFESSNSAIDIHAEADSDFVIGSSAPYAYDLVLGTYSVHTSASSLLAGERRLAEIQQRLRTGGRV